MTDAPSTDMAIRVDQAITTLYEEGTTNGE